MLHRFFLLLSTALCTGPLWAFTCYLTVVKDSCWTKYQVSVTVLDYSDAQIATVEVPSGKAWTRQKFNCNAAQRLMYQAKFKPAFWEGEEDKLYSARSYVSLPDTIDPKDSSWDLSLCYSADFLGVPLPPDASGDCHCDFSAIPKLETPIR